MKMGKSSELKVIVDIAKEAGKILLKYHKKKYKIKNKDKYDFLTTADKESNEYIVKRLRKEFPKDFVLAEESKKNKINYSKRVWMVDPLDGTKNFINNGDGFSVMIGLCINGAPELGVVYAPIKKILYYAKKRKGAYGETRGKKFKLKVGNISNLKDTRLVVRDTSGESNPEERPLDKVLDELVVRERIPSVSIGLKFGLIAEDKADVNVMTNLRGSKWDTCAPQVILEEAGGLVTDLSGNPLDYKQKSLRWENFFIGSSNQILHDKIIKAIEKI